MFKIKFFILILVVCLLTACAPSAQSIQTAIAQTQAVWTRVPTQTPYPTETALPTIAITVIVTEIVTPTFTDTPIFTDTPVFTPTITNTPTKPPPPTATLDPLSLPKADGNYLVGVDIAPGVWRNDGKSNECYWEVTTRTGDIVNNYIGAGGGTAYIPPTGFAFRSERCDIWTFLSPP